VLAATSILGCSGGATADRDFDASVSTPAYGTPHPLVLIDEAHNNCHTADGRYKPFAELLRNDGYEVKPNSSPFSEKSLRDATILVIANARGTNDLNDAPAFTDAECTSVHAWVRGGGALLLITDHYPMGSAARKLGERFGVSMSGGSVEDTLHYDVASEDWTQLVFEREDSLLLAHPITEGRDASERIERVMTFMGQSLSGPAGSVSFLRLSSDAVDRAPNVQVDRDGDDTRVTVTQGAATSAAGRAQGLAFEYGRGRVVILGEAAMLTAQRRNDRQFGMQLPGIDNKQLALNVMHWLSRIL
jgi:hypothetical protein